MEDIIAARSCCKRPSSQVDARKSDEVKNAVSEAVKQFGSLTAALNCAGSIVLKPAHSTSEAEFIATLETNLHSAFYLVKHAAPVIAKAGGGQALRSLRCPVLTATAGSIVLMSSAVTQKGIANHEAIAAAKAGTFQRRLCWLFRLKILNHLTQPSCFFRRERTCTLSRCNLCPWWSARQRRRSRCHFSLTGRSSTS